MIVLPRRTRCIPVLADRPIAAVPPAASLAVNARAAMSDRSAPELKIVTTSTSGPDGPGMRTAGSTAVTGALTEELPSARTGMAPATDSAAISRTMGRRIGEMLRNSDIRMVAPHRSFATVNEP